MRMRISKACSIYQIQVLVWIINITMLRLTQQIYNISSRTYSKFVVHRTPTDKFVTFYPNDSTVAEVITSLSRKQPQGHQIYAASGMDPSLIDKPVPPEAAQATESIKDESFIALLLSGQLFLYEAQNGVIKRCLSLLCEQFNQTNNRNLPERVASGIVDLVNDWQGAKIVSDAFVMRNLPDRSSKYYKQYEEDSKGIIESSNRLSLNMKKIHDLIQARSTNKTEQLMAFTKRMTALMSGNFAFLFAVTYGGYGWDVGEPLSYLTAVGVDLLALLGWFNLQDSQENALTYDKETFIARCNLRSQLEAHASMLSYQRRQLH